MHADNPGEQRPDTLPLFPLHTVLLPGVHLPLHIFEPRYRQLVVDLMSGSRRDQEFGVVAIRNALINDVDRLEQVHEIGCTALLREVKHAEGGRFNIVTTGSQRFRLLAIIDDAAPYLVAQVEWLDDVSSHAQDGKTMGVLAAAARAAHERYCVSAWDDGDWSAPPSEVGGGELAYLLASDCLLPLADRQSLLAEHDPVRRLRMVGRLLSREAGFLGALRAVPVPHAELDELGAHTKLN